MQVQDERKCLGNSAVPTIHVSHQDTMWMKATSCPFRGSRKRTCRTLCADGWRPEAKSERSYELLLAKFQRRAFCGSLLKTQASKQRRAAKLPSSGTPETFLRVPKTPNSSCRTALGHQLLRDWGLLLLRGGRTSQLRLARGQQTGCCESGSIL